MKKTKPALIACSLSVLLIAGYAIAEEPMKHGSVVITPSDLQWKNAPPSLPAGVQVAMLEGDLAKEGPFTARLKLPRGTEIRPHQHPGIEHVTVIEGTFSIGEGDKWDPKSMRDLKAGSFALLEKDHHHFAMSKDGAVVQLHGVGPWGITYVNPADDPARRASK